MRKILFSSVLCLTVLFAGTALAGSVTLTGTASWERINGLEIGTFTSDDGKEYIFDLDEGPGAFKDCIQNSDGKLEISVSLREGDNIDFDKEATCRRLP